MTPEQQKHARDLVARDGGFDPVSRHLQLALDHIDAESAALRALVEAHKEWDDLDGQLCGGTNDRALLDAVDAAYNRMYAAYEQARALLGGAR